MFPTPFRSHQQSAICGYRAAFVWKWHPAFSKLWPGGSCSKGCVNTNFHQARFLSEMCCCLSPVDATCGQTPHLIWFLFQGRCEVGQTSQPARAVVASDYPWIGWEKREGVCTSKKVEKQQKQNSLEEGKLRQTEFSETKILTNLGVQWPWAQREGGRWYLNGKDAAQGISLFSCLHTSVQWCNLRGPCLDGHGAQLSAPREDSALSLILVCSRSEGDSQEGGGWVAKYWERKRTWGIRRCLGRSWRSLKSRWEKIAFSESFGISLLADTEEAAVLEAVPASLQENLNSS